MPTAVCLRNPKSATDVPVAIEPEASIAFKGSDGKVRHYVVWESVVVCDYVVQSTGQRGCSMSNADRLAICQDPNFVLAREQDVLLWPLPYPLNTRLYHNEALVVLYREDREYQTLTAQ